MNRTPLFWASDALLHRSLNLARKNNSKNTIRQLEDELRHRADCAKRGDELIAFIEQR